MSDHVQVTAHMLESQTLCDAFLFFSQRRIQDLQKGGGGTNELERRRREFSRGVWGHAPPEIFENLSL